MFFTSHGKKYVDGGGPVRYLDGSSLARPFDMPRHTTAIAAAFVLAAALIGAVMLYNVLDSVTGAPAREAESVQNNLSRDVAYDLPVLSTLMEQDNETIKQTFADAGLIVYDKTDAEQNPDGLELVKIPSDVSEAEAALYYAQGVSKLSAVDASRLLKGSWTLSVNRSEYTDMRVKFADFSSGSVDAAVKAAIAAEGLEDSVMGDAGTDDAGNTYQAGTVEVDGTSYSWRVSAIALSSVYKIAGLPDTAVYVGVRMTP